MVNVFKMEIIVDGASVHCGVLYSNSILVEFYNVKSRKTLRDY